VPSPPTAAEPDVRETQAAERGLAFGRARAAARRLERPGVATAATALALAGSIAFLLVRLVPDVRGKPLFDDEVLAGLTAVHPLGELFEIVLADRGGAPLHFVLAHVTLLLDPSAEALRWLSLVFALATVPVCYDLGRRLGGRTAAVVSAVVAATSSMLAVYGTVGRMYALFAFASAVAVDLFVRALDRRTPRAALAAAAAAWFLPAVHPYGLVVVAIEALVALALWRGRPLRPALPIFALAVALTPFVIADIRLSERFGVGAFERESVAPPDFAAQQLGEALAAFAGGQGLLALAFFGAAMGGLLVVARRRPAFGAFAISVLAAIPVLLVVVRAEDELVHLLSPRHLTFALPIWAALVGVGVARAVRDLPPALAAVGVAFVVAAAALAPTGITDPRIDPAADRASLAGPADWVRSRSDDRSVLLFYSPVYVAALPETDGATAVSRSGRPLRMVERADYPASSVILALPHAGTRVNEKALLARLGPGSAVGVFPEWLVLETAGPLNGRHSVLAAGRDALVAVRASTRRKDLTFRRALQGGLVTVCGALDELGAPCSEGVLPARLRTR
jgi:Dolichyl-phosphate-mannose-protein mannosyltransferase